MKALLFAALTLVIAGSVQAAGWDDYGSYEDAGQCAECGEGGGHHGCHACGGKRNLCFSMPQSCYNPSFGCYPSTRHMHRYPAFHNYHTREAYNYRAYFDYPWHAGLHEPTSMFSYHVPGEGSAEMVEEAVMPPAPVPEPAARRAPQSPVRSASHLAPVVTARQAGPRPMRR
jgi:hypothetical protein